MYVKKRSGQSIITYPAAKSRIPNGFTAPPLGFVLVWADGTNGSTATDNNLHVTFSLNKIGERIELYDTFGRQIDAVTCAAQTNNVSEGRWRDGALIRFFMPTPTSCLPNVIPDEAPHVLAIAIENKTNVVIS